MAAKAKATAKTGGEAARLGVYTGSFDPLTLGHLDVIRRAAGLFDQLVVAVGEARGKAGLFTTAERIKLIKAACKGLPNVEATSFRGLAVTYARELGAVALVRGLRSATDYTYEMQMASMNRAMAPELETVLLPTESALAHISSSLAKEIAVHKGDVTLLVPPVVAEALVAKVAATAKERG